MLRSRFTRVHRVPRRRKRETKRGICRGDFFSKQRAKYVRYGRRKERERKEFAGETSGPEEASRLASAASFHFRSINGAVAHVTKHPYYLTRPRTGQEIGAQHAARRVLIHGEDQLFPLRTHRGPVPSVSIGGSLFPFSLPLTPRTRLSASGCISRRHVVPFSRMVPLNLHLSPESRTTVNAYALVAVSSLFLSVASCSTYRVLSHSLQ